MTGGHLVRLTSTDGHPFDCWQVDGDGDPRGAVVVLQEIFGVNSHIRGVADGYAAAGYLAVVEPVVRVAVRYVWVAIIAVSAAPLVHVAWLANPLSIILFGVGAKPCRPRGRPGPSPPKSLG